MKFQKHLMAILLIFLGSILIGGYVYSVAEGWRLLDSLYFIIVTMTTIGYGDFVPKTDLGKILTMLFSFIGVGMVLYLVSLVGRFVFKGKIDRKSIRMKEKRKIKHLKEELRKEIEIKEIKLRRRYREKLKKKLKIKKKK